MRDSLWDLFSPKSVNLRHHDAKLEASRAKSAMAWRATFTTVYFEDKITWSIKSGRFPQELGGPLRGQFRGAAPRPVRGAAPRPVRGAALRAAKKRSGRRRPVARIHTMVIAWYFQGLRGRASAASADTAALQHAWSSATYRCLCCA